jgi:glycosyltransferase involved in cell wall biosynthesis
MPFARWLIGRMRPKSFVELGTHTGNSYFSFCQGVQEEGLNTECFAVDTWQGDDQAGHYDDKVFASVRSNNQLNYSQFSTLYRMTFDEALGKFQDRSVDLLHIDGLHTYEAVRHDFESWLPKLTPGGLILFHDIKITHEDFGVWKLWAELKKQYPRCLEFGHSAGLGILQLAGENKRFDPTWLEPGSKSGDMLLKVMEAAGEALIKKVQKNINRATEQERLFTLNRPGFWRRLEQSTRKRRKRLQARIGFDRNWYLNEYPDVAKSGMDPLKHYLEYGAKEGRKTKWKAFRQFNEKSRLLPKELSQQLKNLNKKKKTVLIVTHETSRTGAPILALNLAEKLRNHYTVIVLSMGDGPLIKEFINTSDIFIGPLTGLHSTNDFLYNFLKQVNELHPIDCAIVNSIVSAPILRPLWENNILAFHLIHEFSSYTPDSNFCQSSLFSAKQIYSSQLVLENALSDFPNLQNKSKMILPQGRCHAPIKKQGNDEGMKEREKVISILRPPGSPENLFVVIGLGSVQYRKGVDLFLECASKVRKLGSKVPIRFVWFGSGYDPKNDFGYSCFLRDQIIRLGTEQMCAITHETEQLNYVYESADLLFLSSRLDPLPLVSQDMMAHSKPVVCFDKATGLAQFLMEDPSVSTCVIDYIDVGGAASRIVELANNRDEYQRVGKAFQAIQEKTFNLDRYGEQIYKQCEELIALKQCAERDCKIIEQSGLLDEKFWGGTNATNQQGSKAYIMTWSSGLARKKPFSGFHPGIYAERNRIIQRDPFADYIEKSKPAGPWIHEVITPARVTEKVLKKDEVPTALHLHLYYSDMADSILARVAQCKSRPDLLISVGDKNKLNDVQKALLKHGLEAKRLAIVPNLGRDIGPLLTEFASEIIKNYEIFGHVHTKKTEILNSEETIKKWSEFLYGNLVGDKFQMMDTILQRMEADSSIGIVYPDDPNVLGWGENKKLAHDLLAKMNISSRELFDNINFPVGTMFWARTKALQPLFDLKLHWSDYPQEPLPYDGSMLHAIERILPIICENQNFRTVFANTPGFTR